MGTLGGAYLLLLVLVVLVALLVLVADILAPLLYIMIYGSPAAVPQLRWEPFIFEDPLGGRIVLWPYLPCIRMPSKMRPREFDVLSLISSKD